MMYVLHWLSSAHKSCDVLCDLCRNGRQSFGQLINLSPIPVLVHRLVCGNLLCNFYTEDNTVRRLSSTFLCIIKQHYIISKKWQNREKMPSQGFGISLMMGKLMVLRLRLSWRKPLMLSFVLSAISPLMACVSCAPAYIMGKCRNVHSLSFSSAILSLLS